MGQRRTGRAARRATTVLVAMALGAATATVTATGPAQAAPAAPERAALPPEGDVPDIEAAGWVPVLDEEFTGTTVDESIWTISEGPGKAGPGMNTRDAVRIEPDPGQSGDGTATITTYTVDTNGAAAGGQQHFTGEMRTGAIENAWSGFQPTYGYIEARVKLHQAPDTYSAFWLLSRDWHRAPWGDPAASGPEIDIFEIGNPTAGDLRNEDTGAMTPDGLCDWQRIRQPCDEIAGGTMHWNGFDEHHAVVGQQEEWTGPSPQDNFLTYGLLWTPDGYRMYRNGVETFHSTEAITYSPEHIILDQFQGGDIAGDPPAAGFGDLATSPNKMVIDYVKVWQRPVSDIPNRTVAANSSVAIPFSVADYVSASASGTVGAAKPRPEGVQVAVTGNTNPALVPNDRIVVTGDEPLDANGSLTNAGFESGTTGWTATGTGTTTWTTRKRSGSNAARLTQAGGGGRVQQTITGLRPNTAYTVGGFFNLQLGFTDSHTRTPLGTVVAGADNRLTWINDVNTNGNPEESELEPHPEAGDIVGEFDMGIVDSDAGRSGNQEVRVTRDRNGWNEVRNWWLPRDTAWQEEALTFTTGPTTTSVAFFVDNTVKAGRPAISDIDMSVDDVYVRPLAPPDRTVTLRPVDNTVGSTDVTLTAWVDANGDGTRNAGEDLGSDQFQVTFTRGSSFTNGDFESAPEGRGWELWDGGLGLGADIVVDTPFTPDRVLELGGPGWQPELARHQSGTANQRVTNLQPGATYTLSVTGRGDPFFRVQGFSGTDPCVTATNCAITTPGWSTKSVNFTANAAGTTTIAVADWTPANGLSLVDDVTLTTAAPTSNPPLVSPLLTALGEQRLTSSTPVAVAFSLPNNAANTAITSVTSNNQALIPDSHLKVTAGVQHKALGITSVRDRTGKATITVAWTLSGVAQTAKQIPVIVTDEALVNPGLEHTGNWTGATIATSGQRSGGGALTIDGTTEVKQLVSGLPNRTAYVLGGWVDGNVRVTVRTRHDDNPNHQPFVEEYTTTWASGTYAEKTLGFESVSCTDCDNRSGHSRQTATLPARAAPGGQVEITITDLDTGGPSLVDDLYLIRVPNASPVREMSLASDMTVWNWETERVFDAGRIPAGALSTNGEPLPSVVAVGTSDVVAPPAGMGAVLPASQVRVRREGTHRELHWALDAKTSGPTQRTGRSNVVVQLTDPATGHFIWAPSVVTVNAGSLANGDFQRGGNGWAKWTFGQTSWQLVDKQRWPHLNNTCTVQPVPSPCPETIGPNDADEVLRLSSGIVGYKVTGLSPGTEYVVQAKAMGTGSSLRAVANNGWTEANTIPRWGTTLGQVTIDSQRWDATSNLVFTPMADSPTTTTRDESEVWIFVWDDDDPDADGPDPDTAADNVFVDPSEFACARYTAGETCIDDIGVFVADHVGL